MPAYYSHDRETGQYTVYESGETHVHDLRENFEWEWTPIKRPFISTLDLPNVDYSRDSYVVLILSPDDGPIVFQRGETYPLSENPDREELWPTESTITSTHSDRPAAEQGEDALSRLEESASSTTDVSIDVDPGGDGVEAFAAMYVRPVEGAKIPQDHVFQAYDIWAEQHDIDGTTKGWFTRKLRKVVDLDTDRSRVDGERIQYYTGLTLAQEGQALRDQ